MGCLLIPAAVLALASVPSLRAMTEERRVALATPAQLDRLASEAWRSLAPPGATAPVEEACSRYVQWDLDAAAYAARPPYDRLTSASEFATNATQWWEYKCRDERLGTGIALHFAPDGRLFEFELLGAAQLPEVVSSNVGSTPIPEAAARQARRCCGFDPGQMEFVGGSLQGTARSYRYRRTDPRFGPTSVTLVTEPAGLVSLEHESEIPPEFKARRARERRIAEPIPLVAMALLWLLLPLAFWVARGVRARAVVWRPAIACALLIAALAGAQIWFPLSGLGIGPWTSLHGPARYLLTAFAFFDSLAEVALPLAAALALLHFVAIQRGQGLRDALGLPGPGRRWLPTLAAYCALPLCYAAADLIWLANRKLLGAYQFGIEVPLDAAWRSALLQAVVPVGLALKAGVREECFSRCIPFELASLLGGRAGHRRAAIAVAFVVSNALFPLLHDTSAISPWWVGAASRLGPSLIFSGLYLRYGLYASVAAHVMVDAVVFTEARLDSHLFSPIPALFALVLLAVPLVVALASHRASRKGCVVELAGVAP